MLTNNLQFLGKFLFFNLHSFIAENTIILLFSAEHSFCVSQIVKDLFREAPSQNVTSATKSAILGFPLCLLKRLFL